MKNRVLRTVICVVNLLVALAVAQAASAQDAVPMLINYQGELRSASTDLLAPDGTYDMTFRIYDAESGGTHVWEGNYTAATGNPIEVKNGIFSVPLGSGTDNALDDSIFDGANRWLEIEVAGETLVPRQKVACIAYAMKSQDSHLLDGRGALDFAEAGHTHSGAEIVSGVIDEDQIAPEIARDTEIMSRVLAEDGSGSTLDADLLDGRDSTDYATATHTHDAGDIATGTVAEGNIDAAIARDSEVNAKFDPMTGHDHDGTNSKRVSYSNLTDVPSEFSPSDHDHSGDDITSGTVAEARIHSSLARDAEVDSDIAAHSAIADAHHAKTTTFAELTDTAGDAQIPGSIARDSEIMPTVLGKDGTGSTLDADLLDGKDSANFAASSHNHSGAEITSGTVADGRIAASLARDTEVDSKITTHAGIPDAHHTKTTTFGELTGTASDAQVPATIARDSEVTTHIGNHTAIADAHHAKTTSFAELIDTATDAQIPNTITVNYASSAGDADTVDGAHAAALEESAEIDLDIAAHAGISDAHHARYANSEALAAMGTKANTNPLNHDKTTTFSELTGTVTDAQIPAAVARDTEVDSKITAHTAIVSAHHAKTTSFAELTDAASDGQIPAMIARDSEVSSGISTHAAIADAHHARYKDTEAVSAMGTKSDTNPLYHDKTTSLPWGSITSIPAGFADGIDNDSGGASWSLTGNSGTVPDTLHFVGTTDNQAMVFKVNHSRALRLEPTTGSPNVIGGVVGNWIKSGVEGSVIGGGGQATLYPNSITDNLCTVAGGSNNSAGDGDTDLSNATSATVSGGWSNRAVKAGATVGGGSENEAGGTDSTIGGGSYNAASAPYATIAGGGPSDLVNPYTTNNRVTDDYGTIGGGGNNLAGDDAGTTSDSSYTTVGGGESNRASVSHATVGGGLGNEASGESATVGGGSMNKALNVFATVGGGGDNEASAGGATVGGGEINRAIGFIATVGGGYFNRASDVAATVGGGNSNQASDVGATVGGGYWNTADGEYATIAGGGPSDISNPDTTNNRVTDDYGTIGGGGNNQAGDDAGTTSDASYATVGGGESNTASGEGATIGGGWGNQASAQAATVAGGFNNRATQNYAAVGGGTQNWATGLSATVGGGDGNFATGDLATISGGLRNNATSACATVGGGSWNAAAARYATIAGGGPSDRDNPDLTHNRVLDNYGTIGGGGNNQAGGQGATIDDAEYATVSGGEANEALDAYATVGGGQDNDADSPYATVGGGYANKALGFSATVGGGYWNIADAQYATIAGGGPSDLLNPDLSCNLVTDNYGAVGGGGGNRAGDDAGTLTDAHYATVGGGGYNTASNQYATVAGGYRNQANGYVSAIGGGTRNEARGQWATVPGGRLCQANGDYSFAAGRNAKIGDDYDGSFVFADNNAFDFPSLAENEFAVRCTGGARFVSAIDDISGDPTDGVELSPGANSWSILSDRNRKENFRPVDGREILEGLSKIPVTEWNLKAQHPSIRHIGPMAQDFYAAFGLGESELRINTSDAHGVTLAAIQGLHKIAQEKDTEISTLKKENADLELRVAALEALVQQVAKERKGGDE